MVAALERPSAGKLQRTSTYDERWQEVWQRRCRGESFSSISRNMGIAYNTVTDWYDKYCALEIERSANPEAERAYLLSRFEDIATKAMNAFEDCGDQRARPEHMTNAIRALQMVARLGGLDIQRRQTINVHKGESEVTIKVGGQEMVRRRVKRDPEVLNGQAVEVHSRPVPGRRDGSPDPLVTEEG